MSKQIQKSFKHGLSKIKISNKQIQHSFRSCKRIKTPSFSLNKNHDATENDDSVTLSDIDQFLYENFRSLYRNEYELSKNTESASHILESPRLFDPPPPLENLCGSARFFVPTRSSSSMIIDEIGSSDSSTTENAPDESTDGSSGGPNDFITLLAYSSSPYDDFKRSMEEMVEARMENNGKVDWEFMEELLFCYLDLNNEKSHRAIMRAFVDLVVVLRENSGRGPVSRRQVKSGNGV